MCFSPQRRAIFPHLNFKKWSGAGVFCTFWLENVLLATAACNFWFLLWPHDSAPAALTSLLFDSPDTRIIGKTQHFATSLTFGAGESSFFWLSRYCIFFLLTLLHLLTLLSSDFTSSICFSSAFQLSILSEVYYLNFLRLILVANTLDFIFISYESRKIAHGVTTSAKGLEGRLSRYMPWLFLHATRQRSVVGIDMKIDRFRLSKARQDDTMRLRLLKILVDSFYIHGTIDQPIMLRLKAGRSCQGDQCPHLCGNMCISRSTTPR